MVGGAGLVSFVLLGERLADIHRICSAAFVHPWVASYQIGFGPPLVRSSEPLIARLKSAKSAIEKLGIYLDVCVLDEAERKRLAGEFRRLMVRRLGPVDAEALDDASADVLDLSVRLHDPGAAPPAVLAAMRDADVPEQIIATRSAPDALSGRFFVRLGDPRGTRLLDHDAVKSRVADPERALALELRAPVAVRALFSAWAANLVKRGVVGGIVELDELVPHARVGVDGVSY
ncbi:hypothetical protein L6R52_20840 [Myxococcota bacterium]|nr:hypothetical protein [Myxococcota bacterium]